MKSVRQQHMKWLLIKEKQVLYEHWTKKKNCIRITKTESKQIVESYFCTKISDETNSLMEKNSRKQQKQI